MSVSSQAKRYVIATYWKNFEKRERIIEIVTASEERNPKKECFVDYGSYSLKPYRLEQWMKRNGYTHSEMASALKLPVAEFYRKLCVREQFGEEEIYRLVTLLGPKAAMRVIYFPTSEEQWKLYRVLLQ